MYKNLKNIWHGSLLDLLAYILEAWSPMEITYCCVIMWGLWYARNQFIFQQQWVLPTGLYNRVEAFV